MPKVHVISGATGAGKTTYARALASRTGALRFSIDEWMSRLFVPDLGELEFAWMMERVGRCEAQIWSVAEQALALGVDVILDLGFTTREHREQHRARALALALEVEVAVHYLDAPAELRRTRVRRRNGERDPAVFAFEVTEAMFEFMEPRFEPPDANELVGGTHVRVDD
ncbi:hypothetical protein DB30_04438 [Enhygromyxa salina]|uniref:Zeta toxin n=1 Tax=Enhygromyxa salina TaxID=215803 RepID=A0A0C2D4B3_9BACT|nr:ATP-binding protein [Enhygromyxa salina]KIG16525.1 hypothetical protein DB30_04438 [Enhygromyxa salina]